MPSAPTFHRPLIGIMWVIFDHLRPSGHVMPDHAGDRGVAWMVLAPHDHLHINQLSEPTATGRAGRGRTDRAGGRAGARLRQGRPGRGSSEGAAVQMLRGV
jgi:hypothetical protein